MTQLTIEKIQERFPVKLETVNIEDIHPNDWNPNIQTEFIFQKAIDSIKKFGFVDPILVRQMPGYYEIIDGEHRLKACKELSWTKVQILNAGEVSKEDAQVLLFLMNMRGKDEILRRAEILSKMNEGQLALLPLEPKEIEFEKKLLEFDFTKFEDAQLAQKHENPMKEIYNHLAKAHMLLMKLHEESQNKSIRSFAELFEDVVLSFKKLMGEK